MKTVLSNSHAFHTIASNFPTWDLDELGSQLKWSYRIDEGASGTSTCEKDVLLLNANLRRFGLLELRNPAAAFFMTVGKLET